MKKSIIALLILFTSLQSASAAELVTCWSKDGAWDVTFTLEGRLIYDLEFVYFKQLTARYPTVRTQVKHFGNRTYYETNLSRTDYFDFSRLNGTPRLSGGFFITQNPVGFEVLVDCEAL